MMVKNHGLIYVACPYTGDEAQRAIDVTDFAAFCLGHGWNVFSPITHGHQLHLAAPRHGMFLPTEWEFWKQIDEMYLSVCKELWVLMLPGWDKSKGVAWEIKYATENDIPINYVSVDYSSPGSYWNKIILGEPDEL